MIYRVLTYALLSQDAYNPLNAPMRGSLKFHGWQKNDIGRNQPHFAEGFYAVLYAKYDTGDDLENTFVIAYRGTELDTWHHRKTNLHEDKEIFEHKEPDYYPKARQFYKDAQEYIKEQYVKKGILSHFHIKLTGHSLGGTFAKLVGARTNTKTVSFNGPGIGLWVPQDKSYDSLILNINSRDGIINKYGPSVGVIKEVNVPDGEELHKELNDPKWENLVASNGGSAAIAGGAITDAFGFPLDQHRINHMVNALEEHNHSVASILF